MVGIPWCTDGNYNGSSPGAMLKRSTGSREAPSMSDTNQNARRRFLKLALTGVAAPIGVVLATGAHAADLPHLEESDPVAAALGYKHDTAAVDAAKYPTHKADQVCANCQFAQAPQADGWMPCTLFPGKTVNPKGWCVSWAKKA